MLIANKYAKYVKYSVQVEQLEVYQEFKKLHKLISSFKGKIDFHKNILMDKKFKFIKG